MLGLQIVYWPLMYTSCVISMGTVEALAVLRIQILDFPWTVSYLDHCYLSVHSTEGFLLVVMLSVNDEVCTL